MRRLPWAALAACLASGGAGCAYFNGMYNANRAAREAAQSERAGRMDEARDRWRRAATHAESVTTRYPTSPWVIDALLVEGRAFLHLGDFGRAAPALARAADRARVPAQRCDALVMLGQADLVLGRNAEARQALDSALQIAGPARQGAALLYRGRALLALGLADSAVADFAASSEPHAPYDLAGAMAAARDTAGAGALYDSLAGRRPYVEADWRAALDGLAAAGAEARAADLADRLATRRDVSAGQAARLLLDDAARRLAAGDTAGGARRLAGVIAAAPDSLEARAAGAQLAEIAIETADADADLAAPRDRLRRLALEGGTAGQDAAALLRLLGLVDTLEAAPAAPDAFWFLRAEVLRDSLRASRLAAVDFAAMVRLFPASPWTPKGVVAAIAAGHPQADALRSLLRQRYASSPYTLAAAGDSAGAAAFAALEDSLRMTLAQRGRREPRDAGRARIGPDIGPPQRE